MNIFGHLIAYGKALIHKYYGYALALLLVVFFVILLALNGCTGPAERIVPAEPGVGYSWWEGAPEWMSKDCIYGGYGLMDGFSFKPEPDQIMHVVKMDTPMDGIDGECDVVVLMVETGENERPQGYFGPTVSVVGTAECDKYDDIKNKVEADI